MKAQAVCCCFDLLSGLLPPLFSVLSASTQSSHSSSISLSHPPDRLHLHQHALPTPLLSSPLLFFPFIFSPLLSFPFISFCLLSSPLLSSPLFSSLFLSSPFFSSPLLSSPFLTSHFLSSRTEAGWSVGRTREGKGRKRRQMERDKAVWKALHQV